MRDQGAPKPILLDTLSLQERPFAITLSHLEIGGFHLDLQDSSSGWLRRYAPSNWGSGIISGSLEAAVHRSFLTLVGSLSRLGNREWLSSIDDVLRAEDRLVQLEVAKALGISVPKSIVASSGDRAVDELGSRFVVKPLSLGYFQKDTGPMAVYTNEVLSDEAKSLNFSEAPFIAQEFIEAEHHYRVVTVLDKSWVGKLSAAGRPVDWRQQEQAHHEWEAASDDKCAEMAIRLSAAFGLGYSSQDWLVRGTQRFFIDLNPAGQWLFLPDEISEPVTESIARFLSGET
jgi:hypothetical protein